MTYFVIGGL